MRLAPGHQVFHYRLEELLGKGGMGMVFRARDTKLNRDVALKFLNPQIGLDEEQKERFILEAQTTSALDHPNICTIYEINETEDGALFIAMAYYEGETLRQRMNRGLMSIQEALDITRQILQGLKAAHEQGVIHRDIKPGNIIVRKDGLVKIVDFGIAKLTHGKRLTHSGTLIGTPAYMSPEQFKGESADVQSDLWSVGVILYEMLAGRLPFPGESELALMYSIVNERHQPLSKFRQEYPGGLDKIIDRALAKDKNERYASADEFLSDIDRILSLKEEEPPTRQAIAPVSGPPSIAVLPFVDASPEKDQEYFCDGLTEEIIQALSRLRGIRVVSRNSSFQFKGKPIHPPDIRRQLQVSHYLEGSVRKLKDELRITVQLVNAADGFVLWSERFDRHFSDIFSIQDEISKAIAENLSSQLLTEPATPAPVTTHQLEAYNAYLLGRFHWNKRTVDALHKSIHYFQQAIEQEPDYALGYVGLADAYTTLEIYGALPPDEVMPRAMEAAQKAMHLNPMLPEALTSMACLKAIYEWDWKEAEELFQRAIASNPNYVLAHHWYAINLLTPLKRFEEAVGEMLKALHLDPISLVSNASLGLIYYFAGEYETALKNFQRALELDANYPVTHFFMGETLSQLGRYDEAIGHLEKALEFFGDSSNMRAVTASVHALAGNESRAREILSRLLEEHQQRYVSAFDLAVVHLSLGEEAMAWQWLERAKTERAYLLVYAQVDPFLNPLQKGSKFQKWIRDIFQGK